MVCCVYLFSWVVIIFTYLPYFVDENSFFSLSFLCLILVCLPFDGVVLAFVHILRRQTHFAKQKNKMHLKTPMTSLKSLKRLKSLVEAASSARLLLSDNLHHTRENGVLVLARSPLLPLASIFPLWSGGPKIQYFGGGGGDFFPVYAKKKRPFQHRMSEENFMLLRYSLPL